MFHTNLSPYCSLGFRVNARASPGRRTLTGVLRAQADLGSRVRVQTPAAMPRHAPWRNFSCTPLVTHSFRPSMSQLHRAKLPVTELVEYRHEQLRVPVAGFGLDP